jgi:phage-related protein
MAKLDPEGKVIWKKHFGGSHTQRIYKLIVGEYSGKVDDVMGALGDEFIKWIAKNKSSHSKFIPSIIVMVAQHQAQRIQVIDPVVSLLSLVFQIQKTINS